MKKIFLIIFLFVQITVFSASRYWVGGHPTNNNWSQAGSGTTNWSATSGGAAGASVPAASDDVIFDGAGASGNSASTISGIVTILSFAVTSGYTQTITHNAVLTIAGNVTLNTSYTIAGTSALTISATSTINTGGKVWPNSINFSTTATITINSLLTVTGTMTVASGVSMTFAGTDGFTVGAFTFNGTGATTQTFANGETYTITTAFNCFLARNAATATFTSDHGTNKAIITLNNGATCNVLANFTRIDASAGRTIWTFNGTVTTCFNINPFNDLKTVSKSFAN